MQKIKTEEKKDQDNPQRKAENKNEVLFSAHSYFSSLAIPGFEMKSPQKFLHSTPDKTIDRSFDIFHPPKAVTET